MKLKFYQIILIIIIFLYSRTFYLFYFNDSKILGQDKYFILDKKYEYSNYSTVTFKFEKKINNLLNILEDRFKPEINNYKSIFRLKLIDNENYEYSKEATEKIFLYTFKKVKLNEEYNHEKIIKETIQNSNKVKYFIFEDKIVVCCSHLFLMVLQCLILHQKCLIIQKK